MMFALGVFVSGLVWLAISVALVRRARRLTERRLLGGIATRRAEFETERDELRARHAVQMYRLEREVSRILDRATAHRLEADLKEHEVLSLRAELAVREEDFEDLDRRLQVEHALVQDIERRNAEAGAALRATQHALGLETKRRTMAEAALDETSILADQRRLALTALRAENDVLRARLGEPAGPAVAPELLEERLPRTTLPPEVPVEVPELPSGGSVVPLPTRARQMAAESAEQSAAVVARATRDLQRLAGDADGSLDKEVWRAAARSEPRLPHASMPGEGNIGELVALRMAPPPAEEDKPKANVEENAEVRFFEALAEIRALKRAANQAGE
jgi:hypothetical protein